MVFLSLVISLPKITLISVQRECNKKSLPNIAKKGSL